MSTLSDRVMPAIMAKKLRGSMCGLLKSLYLNRVRYTRKLLVYRRRKNRHSNGKNICFTVSYVSFYLYIMPKKTFYPFFFVVSKIKFRLKLSKYVEPEINF